MRINSKLQKVDIIKTVLVIVSISLFLFSFVIDDIVNVINSRHPEVIISVEDLVKKGNSLKNFSVGEDGCLYSQDIEPWIEVKFEDYNIQNPQILSVIIDKINAEYVMADLYLIGESYEYCSREVFRKGKNYIDLKELPDNVQGIALDFWALNGDMLDLKEISINNQEYYAGNPSGSCRSMALEVLIVFILVEVEDIVQKIRREKK